MNTLTLELIYKIIDNLPYDISSRYTIIEILLEDIKCKKSKYKLLRDTLLSRGDLETDIIYVSRKAIEFNSFEIIKCIHQFVEPEYNCKILRHLDCADHAAARGNLNMIKYYYEHDIDRCTSRAVDWAASNNHFEVVKWLCEEKAIVAKDAICYAAEHGYFEIVQWLHHKVKHKAKRAIEAAVLSGSLTLIKWLFDHGYGVFTDAVDLAAEKGYIDIVRFLYDRGIKCTADAMTHASGNGHFEVVKFIHQHGQECTTDALSSACRNGHFDVFVYLWGNMNKKCMFKNFRETPRNEYTDIFIFPHHLMRLAADNGHYDIIHHIGKNTYERRDYLLRAAIYNNDLDAVKKWHKEHCTLTIDGGNCDARYCIFKVDHVIHAVFYGSLKIVEYLYDNGIRCSKRCISYAARKGYLDIVEFLVERGETCYYNTMEHAVEGGHTDIVKYLLENDKPYRMYLINDAIYYGHFEMVKLFYDHLKGKKEVTVDAKIIDWAIKNNYQDIITWISDQDYVIKPEYTLDWAIRNGQVRLVKWILKHTSVKIGWSHVNNALTVGDSLDIARIICLEKHKAEPNYEFPILHFGIGDPIDTNRIIINEWLKGNYGLKKSYERNDMKMKRKEVSSCYDFKKIHKVRKLWAI